jgi:hypothetical protein
MIYTTQEVCNLIRISRASLTKAIKSGVVQPRKRIRHGRRNNWFTEDDVLKMIDHFYPVRGIRPGRHKRLDLLSDDKEEVREVCENRFKDDLYG